MTDYVLKTTSRSKEILAQIENAVFPSKESGEKYVEHVDMSYKKFMALIKELASLAK